MSDTWTVIFIAWGIALCLLALWIYRMAVKRKQMDKLIGNRYEMRPELGKIRLRSFEDGKELEPITLANAMILIFNCPSCKRQLNPTFAYRDNARVCQGTVTCACGHKVRMLVSLYCREDEDIPIVFDVLEKSWSGESTEPPKVEVFKHPPLHDPVPEWQFDPTVLDEGTFTTDGEHWWRSGEEEYGQALDTQEKNQA